MAKVYTITVTEDQAHILQEACDLLSRVRAGQFSSILNYVPHKLANDRNGLWDDLLRHEMAIPMISFREPLAANAVDLAQTLRHRLAWDRAIEYGDTLDDGSRNWQTMMGLSYDEPLHWGDQPLPFITGKEV